MFDLDCRPRIDAVHWHSGTLQRIEWQVVPVGVPFKGERRPTGKSAIRE
jgi:hypothetical protein